MTNEFNHNGWCEKHRLEQPLAKVSEKKDLKETYMTETILSGLRERVDGTWVINLEERDKIVKELYDLEEKLFHFQKLERDAQKKIVELQGIVSRGVNAT